MSWCWVRLSAGNYGMGDVQQSAPPIPKSEVLQAGKWGEENRWMVIHEWEDRFLPLPSLNLKLSYKHALEWADSLRHCSNAHIYQMWHECQPSAAITALVSDFVSHSGSCSRWFMSLCGSVWREQSSPADKNQLLMSTTTGLKADFYWWY